jgi:hypothetical protein
MFDFFTFKREAAGPPEQVTTRLHGRTSHDTVIFMNTSKFCVLRN